MDGKAAGRAAGGALGNAAGKTVMGIDIGGTNTVLGLFDGAMRLRYKRVMATSPDRPAFRGGVPFGPFADRLADEIVRFAGEAGVDVAAVGMGVPGRVDGQSGVSLKSSNLGWTRVPVAAEMRRRLGVDVVIDNDVRLYTLGEAKAGAGRGHDTIVCVTLGTGLAAGIMIEGTLLSGAHWYAGEIGHDATAGNDARCNCGRIGCLETIASATGIARLAREGLRRGRPSSLLCLPDPDRLTALDVYRACQQGDRLAADVFRQAAAALGAKLLTVSALLDPEIVIIGGGVAAAGAFLLDPIRELFDGFYGVKDFAPLIRPGELGDEAGVTGAAHLAAECR